jgi:hypothetical protein
MKSDQFMNLKVQRSDANAWETSRWRDNSLDKKLAVSLALAGASLLVYGAFSPRRAPKSNLWWQVSGAGLLSLVAARRWRQRTTIGSRRYDSAPSDVVTLESVDSFPASDAPSSNATTVSPQPLRSGD